MESNGMKCIHREVTLARKINSSSTVMGGKTEHLGTDAGSWVNVLVEFSSDVFYILREIGREAIS